MSVREAGQTDDLAKSINYGEVSHFAKEFMENHTYRLLEAVVERLARAILLKWPQIIRADLELKKPWAPIGLPLDTVSVEIEREWHTAYLALGSNMGDRRAHLEHAVRALEACEDCRVLKVSDFIETEPYGVTEQDAFLNGALALRTLKTPGNCLRRSIGSKQRREECAPCAGVPGHWIWISCCTMAWCWIRRTYIFPI